MDIEKYMDDDNLESLGSDASTEESGETSSQPEGELNTGEESPEELSLKDQLNDFETKEGGEGKEAPSADLLGMANEMGLLRNGMPIEFESEDQIKEALSKGMDYTLKTQELSEERKNFETEMETMKASFDEERQAFATERVELENESLASNVMLEVLEQLESEDPSAYDLVTGRFMQAMNAYNRSTNNPAVKALESKIGNLESTLKGYENNKVQEENQKTIEQWETELTQIQTDWGPKLRTLGIKPNWENVKNAWANDKSESLSVQDALLAAHGAEITKAMESQKKLMETKLKSSQRQGPSNNGTQQTNNNQKTPVLTAQDRVTQVAQRLGLVS